MRYRNSRNSCNDHREKCLNSILRDALSGLPSFCRVRLFLVSRYLFCVTEVAEVSVLISRDLFFGIEILHSVVRHWDRLLPGINPCVFLGLDILYIGGQKDLDTERRSKISMPTKKTFRFQLKESHFKNKNEANICMKVIFACKIKQPYKNKLVANCSPVLDKNVAPNGSRNFIQYWGWGLEEGPMERCQTPALYWINFSLRKESPPFVSGMVAALKSSVVVGW